MSIRWDFPHEVRDVETVWIPMSDGCRLAARLWIPESAEKSPVPALFEYIPYRRRDFTRARDEPIHHYFAGFGYASLRVDMRGSGDSDGLMVDEYLPREQQDAVEVIEWLAAQPWCSGRVGMFGKSWGGYSALQVAAHRPPALEAIITVCSTDDRYADADDFIGGCLTEYRLIWGSMFLAFLRRPPDPAIVGDRWREMWLKRLANEVQPMEAWFRHSRRDAFWKHGSVCEDFEAIRCPVYAVGGWMDGFSNAVFRLLSGLKCPRKGLIGPWGHQYAHEGIPGPSIGFLQEALRWWDHWLKGRDTGIASEPMLRVWLQDSVAPGPQHDVRPGRWVEEPAWPSPHVESQRHYLNDGTLGGSPEAEKERTICSPQSVGLASGTWQGAGIRGDQRQPGDQRSDDDGSLCFDSAPLQSRLEILGAPVATLELTSDQDIAMVAVRLNSVAPDGSALLVTRGILNLARRESHEDPTALEPGERYTVRVELDGIAHAFPKGHRLRVAVSTSYWPRAWPTPKRGTLGVFTGKSYVDLPVRPPRNEDEAVHAFEDTEAFRPMRKTILRSPDLRRSVERDDASGEVVITEHRDNGIYRIDDHGLEVEDVAIERFTIEDDAPTSAKVESKRRYGFRRGDWSVRLEAEVTTTCTEEEFMLRSSFDAYESEKLVDSKTWRSTFPRDFL